MTQNPIGLPGRVVLLKGAAQRSWQLLSLGHCLLDIHCTFIAFSAELSFYGLGQLPGHVVLTGRREKGKKKKKTPKMICNKIELFFFNRNGNA